MNHRVSPYVLLALCAMLVSEAWAAGKSVYGLSFQLSQPLKAPCLLQAFHVWQEPDPFFKNLKQVKGKRTLQYRRGHNIVANYPDSTIVRVVFSQGVSRFNTCHALPPVDPQQDKFHLEWLHDSHMMHAN